MPKNKIGMSFKGFEELAAKFEEIGGDLKEVTSECLEKSHDHITPKLHDDMKKHKRTGRTEASIVDKAQVTWNGTKGSVDIGFDMSRSGLTSIYLMYGTPRAAKDSKLYNDIYGAKVRKEIKELQEKIFKKKMDAIMKGG